MDSFELNKIIGAVLGTLLFVMGVGFLAEAVYHPHQGVGPGYALPEPEGTVVAEAEPAEPEVPLGVLLASADAEAGAAAARKCQSCHNFGEGEPNKTGPGLFDVVDRVIGGHEGFAYSDVLAAHREAGDIWTYENLDAFIASPKGFAPGTKMTFAGIKSAEERANLLAYLQTLSASPKPFPAPEAAATEEAPPSSGPTTAEGANEPSEQPETTPANVTATPTETQTETQVEGTPTGSSLPAANPEAPADAAPAGTDQQTQVPATESPSSAPGTEQPEAAGN